MEGNYYQQLIGNLVRKVFNYIVIHNIHENQIWILLIEMLNMVEHNNILNYSFKMISYEKEQGREILNFIKKEIIKMNIKEEIVISFIYCCLNKIKGTNKEYYELIQKYNIPRNSNEGLLCIHYNLLEIIECIKRKKKEEETIIYIEKNKEILNKFPKDTINPINIWKVYNFNFELIGIQTLLNEMSIYLKEEQIENNNNNKKVIEKIIEMIGLICNINEEYLIMFNNIKRIEIPKEIYFNAEIIEKFEIPKYLGKIILRITGIAIYQRISLLEITRIYRCYSGILNIKESEIINIFYTNGYKLYQEKKYLEAIIVINTLFSIKKTIFKEKEDKRIEEAEKIRMLSRKAIGKEEEGINELIEKIKKIEDKKIIEKWKIIKRIDDIINKTKEIEYCIEEILGSLERKGNKIEKEIIIEIIDIGITFEPRIINNITENKRKIIKRISQEMEKYYKEKHIIPFEVIRFKIYEIIVEKDNNINKKEKIENIIEEIKKKEEEKIYNKTKGIDILITLAKCYYFKYIINLYNIERKNNDENIIEIMKTLKYLNTINQKYNNEEINKHKMEIIPLLIIITTLFEMYGDQTNQIKCIENIKEIITKISITNEERISCYLKIIESYISMGYIKNAEIINERIEKIYKGINIEGEIIINYIMYLIMKIKIEIEKINQEDRNINNLINQINILIKEENFKKKNTEWERIIIKTKLKDVISLYYCKIGDYNKGIEYRKKTLCLMKKISEIKNKEIKTKKGIFFYTIYSFIGNIIESYLKYGWIFEIKNKYKEALMSYQEAEKIGIETGSLLRLIEIKTQKGELEMKKRNYEEAKKEFKEINNISCKIKKYVSVKRNMIMTFMELGDLYRKTNHYNTSMEYYQIAKEIIEELLQENIIETFPLILRDSTTRESLIRESLKGKIERTIIEEEEKEKEENINKEPKNISEVYQEIKNRILYKIIKLNNIKTKNNIKSIQEYKELLKSPFNSPITKACILNQIGINQIENKEIKEGNETFKKALLIAEKYCEVKLIHCIIHNILRCNNLNNKKCYYHIMSIGITYREIENIKYNKIRIEEKITIKEIDKNLPKEWTIICLSIDEIEKSIVISNINKEYNGINVRRKLKKGKENEIEKEIERIKIIKKEIEIIFSEINGKEITENDKRKHWRKVFDIDNRIKDICYSLENKVLGWLKIIFYPRNYFRTKYNDNLLYSIIKNIINKEIIEIDILYLLIIHFNKLTNEEINECLNYILGIEINPLIIEILINQFKNIKLQEKLEIQNKSILLILDKQLHCLPWESMPNFDNIMITRLPSIEPFLIQKLNNINNTIPGILFNGKRGYYIINPTHDLIKTQNKLLPLINKLNWNGIYNQIPNEDLILKALYENDIILYCGHGSGEQFIHGKKIKSLNKCGIAFLMGCNSVELNQQGDFEPSGLPIDYLQAGSPLVCGNLWSVPDNDLDNITIELLNWLNSNSSNNQYLINILNNAKKKCICRYFMGASLVCYGIPVLKKNINESIIIKDNY
ncbi:DNA double-strand break repair Rad50 ATPase, putative [Entamoeba dispar SAW760]|uniref:separase n=1 Tax=Entamoeba dispar (strain ATCC PRA-260 / SAW760) TaxID=370354 RepID=B0EBV3_ENTDS|nr:DNA double-strand break repair Rad50 ATPase, putative [Entamoeba dispar SAW760]EDR27998.1 DNA double-strand break repair Rad50 ATPase, putative [Entamoeba dispar SAW760]|eukprot:EDR27998.1 DNA double-strand break repair Rad50 ATPase, putative [Entamoeba dispar SAW760]